MQRLFWQMRRHNWSKNWHSSFSILFGRWKYFHLPFYDNESFHLMIPMEILMLPLYKLVIGIKLVNTMGGVVLPFVTQALPIFFFRQYVSSLPKDFADAGRIDGCSEYGIFIRIMAPLMKPSFASMGIFIAMNSWNAFLWPLIVLRDAKKFTLSIGFLTLLTPYGSNYQILLAGSVMSIIPIVVLYLFFQKYFIAGMTAGGVKG